MSFRRTWQRFARAPRVLVPTPGVRESWHQGRRWYHVWVLTLTDEEVQARRAEVLAALGDTVIPFCPEDPHVTVWVHGFSPPPFHVEEGAAVPVTVGRASAFLSCPILEVRADVAALRRGFSTPEERWSPYRPHLTVARFIQPVPTHEIVRRLRPFRRLPPLTTEGRFQHRLVDAWDDTGRLYPPSAATSEPAPNTPRSVT